MTSEDLQNVPVAENESTTENESPTDAPVVPTEADSRQTIELAAAASSAGVESASGYLANGNPAEENVPATGASAHPDTTSRSASQGHTRNRSSKSRPEHRREKSPRARAPKPAMFRRFVFIGWSGKREPIDDMFWAEAEREGDWIVIRDLEIVRTRKEIFERLQDLPSGLVGVDFNLSYPKEFFELLKSEAAIETWRSLAKRVRDDLKKNADDGIRLWIERMGKYRESNLDPEPPPVFRRENDSRGRFSNNRFQTERRTEPLPAYEQPSLAERFRRTDLAIRKPAGIHLSSPIQIGYNRLTNRYEFTDTNGRGRAALLGISMLEQLIEVRPEVAIWPMSRPKEYTIVEVLPWTFTGGKTVSPDAFRKTIAVHEDNGWEFPQGAIDLAARNPDAQRALLCLLGLIKTETRENRERRPIRDYVDAFYQDPQIQTEGWFYSIGYRVADDRHSGPEQEPTSPQPARDDKTSFARATNDGRTSLAPSEAPPISDHDREIPIAEHDTSDHTLTESAGESSDEAQTL